MTLADTIGLALRNLRQAKLRTTLTVLGVSIGIASLAAMVSFGVGLQEQMFGRFTRSGLFDSITVMQARDLPGFMAAGGRMGRGGGRGRGAAADRPRPLLDDAGLAKIAALAHVREAYPQLRPLVEFRFETFTDRMSAAAIAMSARNEGAFQTFAAGGFFTSETADDCLLSLDFAKRITERDPKTLVGSTATLTWTVRSAPGPGTPPGEALLQFRQQSAPFRIVGIVEREPGPGMPGAGISGLMIALPRARSLGAVDMSAMQAMMNGGGDREAQYLTATVKVERAQDTEDVEKQIKEMGYNAFSLNDLLSGARRAFLLLDIALSLIGSIALAVSSLGIVNTMVMSILERTREIGIMKAIGGSDSDVRRIFLVEASAIGAMGGVAGIAIGWAVGRAINFGANVYIQSQGGPAGNLFSLPVWLVAGAIAFAILVSLIAGSYPAARAARLDPIQALRHD